MKSAIQITFTTFITLYCLIATAEPQTQETKHQATTATVIVVPNTAESKAARPYSKSFTLPTKAQVETTLTLKVYPGMSAGNYAEVRSPKPFDCQEEDYAKFPAIQTTVKEEEGYGQVPTPMGWYSCQVSLMGNCHQKDGACWHITLIPSVQKQSFQIESYDVEED